MTGLLERIVVGTSLDTESDAVLRAALSLRRLAGAAVHLVHGFPLPVVFGGGLYGGATLDAQFQADRRRYDRLLDEQLERIGADRGDFASVLIELDAGHRLLSRVADDLDADLIVVGASEAHGPFAPLLGSTADRLLRHSRRPVLVVRGDFAPPQRVLAATDLSELSGHAVADGLSLLGQLPLRHDLPPEVDVLFVLSNIDREGSAHWTPSQVDRFAERELESFVGRLGRAGTHLRPVLRHGTPRHEILAYAESHAPDLVLLGTHGRSGFERLLLGSVAVEVLRRLPCHALVVPPEPAAKAARRSDEADTAVAEPKEEMAWSEMS